MRGTASRRRRTTRPTGCATASTCAGCGDYSWSFGHFRLEQSRFADLLDAAERNKKYLEAAKADAKLQEAFQEKVVKELTAEAAAFRKAADKAAEHLAALQQRLKAIQADLEARINDNLATARKIIRTQLDAARRIDERFAKGVAGRTNGVGIYDRDYYRQERPGFSLGLPQSAVVILIIANVAVYLIDGLLAGNDHKHWVADTLLLRAGSLTQPWMWWQFLTYGFVHNYHGLSHIIFNMLGLWFFGREIEAALRPGRIPAALLGAGRGRRSRLGGRERPDSAQPRPPSGWRGSGR